VGGDADKQTAEREGHARADLPDGGELNCGTSAAASQTPPISASRNPTSAAITPV
jgi:hypothetical protein